MINKNSLAALVGKIKISKYSMVEQSEDTLSKVAANLRHVAFNDSEPEYRITEIETSRGPSPLVEGVVAVIPMEVYRDLVRLLERQPEEV